MMRRHRVDQSARLERTAPQTSARGSRHSRHDQANANTARFSSGPPRLCRGVAGVSPIEWPARHKLTLKQCGVRSREGPQATRWNRQPQPDELVGQPIPCMKLRLRRGEDRNKNEPRFDSRASWRPRPSCESPAWLRREPFLFGPVPRRFLNKTRVLDASAC